MGNLGQQEKKQTMEILEKAELFPVTVMLQLFFVGSFF